ncbi:laminin subunit alpha-3-like [Ctenodactylus gundi]
MSRTFTLKRGVKRSNFNKLFRDKLLRTLTPEPRPELRPALRARPRRRRRGCRGAPGTPRSRAAAAGGGRRPAAPPGTPRRSRPAGGRAPEPSGPRTPGAAPAPPRRPEARAASRQPVRPTAASVRPGRPGAAPPRDAHLEGHLAHVRGASRPLPALGWSAAFRRGAAPRRALPRPLPRPPQTGPPRGRAPRGHAPRRPGALRRALQTPRALCARPQLPALPASSLALLPLGTFPDHSGSSNGFSSNCLEGFHRPLFGDATCVYRTKSGATFAVWLTTTGTAGWLSVRELLNPGASARLCCPGPGSAARIPPIRTFGNKVCCSPAGSARVRGGGARAPRPVGTSRVRRVGAGTPLRSRPRSRRPGHPRRLRPLLAGPGAVSSWSPRAGSRAAHAAGRARGARARPAPPRPGCAAAASRRGRLPRSGAAGTRGMAAPPRPALSLPLLLLLALRGPPGGDAARSDPRAAARRSLHPPYFNLAEAARIWATATCGERGPDGRRAQPELYCKLAGGPAGPGSGRAVQGQFCDYCNSEDSRKAHPATHAIDGSERWWQSPPLSSGTQYNKVNLTLDLGQLFHVAYVFIKFANSPRPDLWVLERSVDFGSTYSPWQYFAHSKIDCLKQFGVEANRAVTRDDDVLCVTEYSRLVPLENGEVVVSLVNGRPSAKNFTFSDTLSDFTKATNIRLRFLRTNTLLGHLLSKAQRDPTVTRRYYYSIKDISIGGQCVCNGHAEVCSTNNPEKLFQCECQHHTCGATCNHCCAGFNQKPWQPASGQSRECEACNCHGHASDCYYDPDVERQQASLNIQGIYAGGGVCINCQHNTDGVNCEKCAKGYYRPYGVPVDAPHGCVPCGCDPERAEGCEEGSGDCRCKPNFNGDKCEKCAAGHHNFPFCSRVPAFPVSTAHPEDPAAENIRGCDCNLEGVLPEICDDHGRCLCRPGVEGPRCDTCRVGFYSFPICHACQCSTFGSYPVPCNPVSGQCECLPGITGQRCDRCLSGAYDFPHCQECQCHEAGTLSGIGECGQEDGDCHCKAHVTGDACDTCEDGYFALEKNNYFGCQGCQCDVGGALTSMCSGPSGVCQCREHIVGKVCQRPENNYYFPDLHRMKYEIEDGTVPSGKDLRFGFDPLVFPGFSWRGYAQMTSVQNEVRISLTVGRSSLSSFRVILRYVNPGSEAVSGHITICPSWSKAGATQSKEITFPPSKQPAFVTVPTSGFPDPFSLTPGTWVACIKAEGVLLDFLVLLPRDYYKASALQLPVTEPCAQAGPPQDNCLLYQHLPVTRFACTLACEASLFLLDGNPRPLVVRQPTPAHPIMVDLSGREVELHLQLHVPQVGHYVVMLEYATEADGLFVVDVSVRSSGLNLAGQVKVYSCKYSVPCRSIVIDNRTRVAVYELLADADIQLKVHKARLLLHQICIIPIEEFSAEYLRPQVHCIASYGPFVNQSATCVSLAYETPPTALILDVPNGQPSPLLPQGFSPSEDVIPGLTLQAPQIQVTLRGVVPHLGRYVLVIHFHQALEPSFSAQVFVDGGQPRSGSFRASFCPHVLGCRDQVISDNQIEFDISQPAVAVTVKVPEGRSLVLFRVLVVPAENYDYQILHKKSVDKSFEFITNCGGNSFYIE